MCHFLSVFQPIDVYPCVTDEESWTPEISIEGLFGHLCTGTVFSHDHEMRLIRDVGTVPHPKSSPQRSSCERGESATPKSSRFGPRPGRGPLSLQPASGRPSPAVGEASDEHSGSVFPNKCQGTTDIGTPTICRAKLGMPSRERPEPKDGGFLARSFLGWLDPQGGESGRTKRTVSEKIDREHVNTTTKRKRNISPRTARSGPDDGELGNSPIDRIHQQQGQSNPLDVGLQGSVQDDDASCRLSSREGTNTCREKPPITGTGTQYDPLALSDTSPSEMDTEEDDETQLHATVDEPYDRRSRSGSPVSLADSTFNSSPSDPHTGKSTDPRRIQLRKEIYKAVKGDDGHIWGREYSLVSTNTRHDQDDLEL